VLRGFWKDITWRSRAPDGGSRPADAWCAWEDAVVSLEPNAKPNVYSDRPPAALLALVRISEPVAVRDAGHQGSDTTRERMLSALDRLARQ